MRDPHAFDGTRWQKYYKAGKSGNGSYAITKENMSPKIWYQWQARECTQQAMTNLDQEGGDPSKLMFAEELLLSALENLRRSKLQD
jgi:hypothetical protein